MELLLTQHEADGLIASLKKLTQKTTRILTDGDRGIVNISSNSGRKFSLRYFYSSNNIHLQFMDEKTKLTLIRMNLNDSFHKNSTGEKIYGNRVNIFSEDEFYSKGDGTTHTKASPLPKGVLRNTRDILEAIDDLFNYTNTSNRDKLQLTIPQPLNF